MKDVINIKNKTFAFSMDKRKTGIKVKGKALYGSQKKGHRFLMNVLHICIKTTYPKEKAPFIVEIPSVNEDAFYYIYDEDVNKNPTKYSDIIFKEKAILKEYLKLIWSGKKLKTLKCKKIKVPFNAKLVPSSIKDTFNFSFFGIQTYSNIFLFFFIMFSFVYGAYFLNYGYIENKSEFEKKYRQSQKDKKDLEKWENKIPASLIVAKCLPEAEILYENKIILNWELEKIECNSKGLVAYWKKVTEYEYMPFKEIAKRNYWEIKNSSKNYLNENSGSVEDYFFEEDKKKEKIKEINVFERKETFTKFNIIYSSPKYNFNTIAKELKLLNKTFSTLEMNSEINHGWSVKEEEGLNENDFFNIEVNSHKDDGTKYISAEFSTNSLNIYMFNSIEEIHPFFFIDTIQTDLKKEPIEWIIKGNTHAK